MIKHRIFFGEGGLSRSNLYMIPIIKSGLKNIEMDHSIFTVFCIYVKLHVSLGQVFPTINSQKLDQLSRLLLILFLKIEW